MLDIFDIMITIHSEGGIEMDMVIEKLKVTNSKNPSKSMETEAIADTGIPMSVLSMDLIQKLGLEKIDETSVKQHKGGKL